MFKNKLGQDSPIPKFKQLKIWRHVELASNLSMTLEEDEFNMAIDVCINVW